MKTIIYSLFFLGSFSAIAEEAAHHEASLWDLKYPLINFIILLAILSKVVKPLREKFNKNAEEVKSLIDSAAKNSQDAKEKLKQYESKIKNLDSELVKITTDYRSDAAQFAKNQSEETQTTIHRMKKDLANKLDGERKELISELNHDLLNKVVLNVQTTVKNNKDFQVKATQKIIAELR